MSDTYISDKFIKNDNLRIAMDLPIGTNMDEYFTILAGGTYIPPTYSFNSQKLKDGDKSELENWFNDYQPRICVRSIPDNLTAEHAAYHFNNYYGDINKVEIFQDKQNKRIMLAYFESWYNLQNMQKK